ncbi:radical SAM protein [Clostridium chromiireducens]|uniref:Radical SAM protein n=1 Tax=Clostridium chromiireducens TaxID=225345 RepID=A0A964W0S6_9CLOT|nr:radical SAM protein [Clostridium chromiireducens]MVX62332.1 radical SAM protein [Clostridium chromiireducens]
MIQFTKLKEHNRKNLREIIPLQKPFTVLIEPSNLCNFKCVQCFQSIPGENYFSLNKKNMTMDCFNKIIDDIKNWEGDKIKVLKLSLYGEPFMNPNFGEMLRIAKEADIAERIETTSNVSLLNEEICNKLVEYGIDYIRVSIYSPLQEKHINVTNSDIDINKIHENLATLQRIKREKNSEKPFVAVKMLDTFSEENQVFMEKYNDVADELYIDQPHNWIPYEEKNFIESLYKSDAEKVKENLEEHKSKKIACSMSFFTLAVRSNGDVNPCCIDWIGATKIGNVLEENLYDIWKGDKMFEFWKMQLENRKEENASCRNCEYYLSEHYIKDNVDGVSIERLK